MGFTTDGAKKYAENNWKLGIPTERFIESTCRHWAQYLLGEVDEDHLSAVVFNILGLIWNEEKSKQGFSLENYIKDLRKIPGSKFGELE